MNALPVLVAYAVPQCDCGGWSAGGATPDGYRAWTRKLDAGIDRAAGFALSVSNFGTDATQIAYGRAISAAAGGSPS